VSNEIEVLTAQIPDQPEIPVTSFANDVFTVTWVAPASNGNVISKYSVLIRQSDGTTYSEELTDCDGSDTTILTNTVCNIPAQNLNSAPFSI
jgi:hypothetical protein